MRTNFTARSALSSALLLTLLCVAIGCGEGESGSALGEPERAAEADAARIDTEELERLRALGYVEVGSPLESGAEVGVLTYDRERAQDGLNLFTNSHRCRTELVDMEGRLLHSWTHSPCGKWANTVLLPDGDLLVVGRDPHPENARAEREARYLVRLTWQGELRWEVRIPVHHDVELTPRGRILSLSYGHRQVGEVHPSIPLRDHYLVLFSAEGELLEEVSLWELLGSAPEIQSATPIRPRTRFGKDEVDAIHSNSVEWMRHPHLVGRHPIFAPSGILVSLRHQDTLAIFDWDARKLIWAWGRGELSGPHDAVMLPDGNIMAFDNGLGRGWSRVVEVDPIARKIVWEYRASDPESFYSGQRGANQRLGNGNTLITESDEGHVIEVTPDGEIVWEFLNPSLTEKREPRVIVRMRRIEGLSFTQLEERLRRGAPIGALAD